MAWNLPLGADFLPNFFTSSTTAGMDAIGTCLQGQNTVLGALPSAFANVNAVFLNHNLAVIPGDWQSGPIQSAFYDIQPEEPCMASVLEQIKAADFIAYDHDFFDVIGSKAKIEKIQTFPPDLKHVHEAPVYLPESNELLYSDTSLTGLLFAINIDTHAVRQINLEPALQNVNGGTRHKGRVYVTTNGGSVRGIFEVNVTTGRAEAIVNHYRGRHLNSPNDLIFDSKGNMYFTDPDYGVDSKWPGVQPSELPNSVYRVDAKTRSVQSLTVGVVTKPNGLALSADESILYIADSNTTSEVLKSERGVWAFDNRHKGLLENPRLVYLVEGGWPDGLRISKNGLLFSAVYGGVDVVDPKTGFLLGKVNTPDDIVFNLEPARGKGQWLLTGQNHIYKVTIKEQPLKER
ncbi:uncharacterized protein RHO25_004581 [Cercospora beticola]|uniref:SMP-30/Gluconolactonase/LRE-like region domain-containing protein n=2 Tax=Cercospora beticola TaxID=122368 RepID=A0ABZ0NK82_CERBT|nr:hypothetical protein RHO25_004581 [Cercospora beticola]CAK1361860.1 unnamed protein product [Cercospora beticola]